MRHTSHLRGGVYMTRSHASADAAASLVGSRLGESAREYYRSSRRVFPLFYDGYFFSVSHTCAITALAMSTLPIGVDIERHIPGPVVSDIGWALTDHELQEVNSAGSRRLTEIWTAKEASGKALGVGLQAAPRQIVTAPDRGASSCRLVEMTVGGRIAVVNTWGWWSGDHHLRLAWF